MRKMRKPIPAPQESLLSARMVAGILLGISVVVIAFSWPRDEPSEPAEVATVETRAASPRFFGSEWLFQTWRRNPAPPAAAPIPTAPVPDGKTPLLLPPDLSGIGEGPRAIRSDGTLSTSRWSSRWGSSARRVSSPSKARPERRAPAAVASSNEDETDFEDDQAFERWWNEPEPDESDLALEEDDETDREFEAWWASDE